MDNPVLTNGYSETGPAGRWAKRMFLFGNWMLVIGGVFHTVVHVTELMGPVLEATLRIAGTVEVQGFPLQIWDIFQGQSLLYGIVVVALGLSNLSSVRGTPVPNLGSALVTMAMFAGMTAIGALYLGPLQTVGGPIGMLVFAVTPVAWVVERRKSA